MHHAAKLFDALPKPFELFVRDAVVLRVARLHIGVLELLEPRAILLKLARPDIGQTRIDPLGLSAQERNIVVVRCVERADEKDAMVEPLGCLMQLKCGFFVPASLRRLIPLNEKLFRRG